MIKNCERFRNITETPRALHLRLSGVALLKSVGVKQGGLVSSLVFHHFECVPKSGSLSPSVGSGMSCGVFRKSSSAFLRVLKSVSCFSMSVGKGFMLFKDCCKICNSVGRSVADVGIEKLGKPRILCSGAILITVLHGVQRVFEGSKRKYVDQMAFEGRVSHRGFPNLRCL